MTEVSAASSQRSDSANSSADAQAAAYKKVVGEVLDQLLVTFQTMLPADKAAQFAQIGPALRASVMAKLDAVAQAAASAPSERDARRSRFLLRLVLSRISHLFAGPEAVLPRSLIDAVDFYLMKAFGPIMYEELNNEAVQLLWGLGAGDDQQLWDAINKNPPMRRFVDTIFIRILFRFENFTAGKKTFVSIVDKTMMDKSNHNFTEDNFYAIFEALFSELWDEAQDEPQRVRWDFLFGDGTSGRLVEILRQGLARWLKRRVGATLLSTSKVGRR